MAALKLQLIKPDGNPSILSPSGSLNVVFSPDQVVNNPAALEAVMQQKIKNQKVLPSTPLESTSMVVRNDLLVTLISTNSEDEERHVAILHRDLGVCRIFMDINLTNPGYVAMTANNRSILVSEEHRIIKISIEGVVETMIGDSTPGDAPGSFCSPSGMAIHPESEQVYVADHSNHRIQVLNPDMTYCFLFLTTPPFVKDACCPTDIAFDSNGILYIADDANNCILKYTANGHYISMFSSFGCEPGLLNEPTLLVISDQYVYICEIDGDRISVFDVNGYFQFVFSTHDRMCVTGFDVTSKGDLYLSDYSQKNIVLLS